MNKPVVYVLGAMTGVLLQIAVHEAPNLYSAVAVEIQMSKPENQGKMMEVSREIASSKTTQFLLWLDDTPDIWKCFVGMGVVQRQWCIPVRKTFTFLTGVDRGWYKEQNGEK